MLEWGVDRIFTIIVDNVSSNDVPIDYMKRINDKDYIILGGECLHMQCATHILNVIVIDGLKYVHDSVKRFPVRYIRSSPTRFYKFKG